MSREKLKVAYHTLFWAALVVLATAIAAWFIDQKLGAYAFGVWLLLIVMRAAIVVFDGARSGSIIYAPDRFDRSLQPTSYRIAMILNSVVILAALVLAILAVA